MILILFLKILNCRPKNIGQSEYFNPHRFRDTVSFCEPSIVIIYYPYIYRLKLLSVHILYHISITVLYR